MGDARENPAKATPARPYHHGNLRQALIQAALERARKGGAAAVVLREVTRDVGVTVRAAYRHFADREELVDAVSVVALAALARTIEAHLGRVKGANRVALARARLQAVGEGYIEFATGEPGWFDVAMFTISDMAYAFLPDAAGDSGKTAFQLLTAAVEGVVATGDVPAEKQADFAIYCWSTVHGFATLANSGPLRDLPLEERTRMGRAVVATTVAAWAAPPNQPPGKV